MKFGTLYVPDWHPTPSFASSGFGVSLLVFGRSGLVLRLRGAALPLCCCMRKACIIRHGGRWPRQPPPPLGLSQ